jgi:hypothetical protein
VRRVQLVAPDEQSDIRGVCLQWFPDVASLIPSYN